MIKMSYNLNTTSLDAYKANLDKLTLVVSKAAADVESNAKTSITKQSGRYKKYNKHYSSMPGTPPNSDTGYLANSIMHRMTGRTSAQISAIAKYAAPLELGWTAKGGGKVPARPFLRPALDKVMPSFKAACKSVLKGK